MVTSESGLGVATLLAGCSSGVCEPTAKSIYVHLCSGRVVEVTDAVDLQLTASDVVIRRMGAPPVRFPRQSFYHAGCQPSPPPYFS